MFTKNPFRIVLAILFALWALSCLAVLSPLSWAIGLGWFCLSVRMATHMWPARAWRELRNR